MRNKLTKITHIPFIILIGAIGGSTITSCTSNVEAQPPSVETSSSSAAISSSGNSSSSVGNGISSSSLAASSSSAVPSSPSIASSSSVIPISSSSLAVTGNTFTDSRDNKIYKWVEIGTQTWMAENLNYNASGSVCHSNDPANCDKYGRLYNWWTAMALSSSCNSTSCSSQIGAKHRGICPSGWHIPNGNEWTALINAVGGSSVAGRKLKATEGWSYCGPSGSGALYLCEDAHGFAALPGGYGRSGGNFVNAGNYGSWWSASEDYASDASYRHMEYNREYADQSIELKSYLYSVRCLQD